MSVEVLCAEHEILFTLDTGTFLCVVLEDQSQSGLACRSPSRGCCTTIINNRNDERFNVYSLECATEAPFPLVLVREASCERAAPRPTRVERTGLDCVQTSIQECEGLAGTGES